MRKTITLLLLTAFSLPCVNSPARAEDTVKSLTEAYDKACDKWQKKHGKKSDSMDFKNHPMTQFSPKLKALAEADKNGGQALRAMIWTLENCRFVRFTNIANKQELYGWALDGLKTRFAGDPRIGAEIKGLIELAYHYGPQAMTEVYQAVIDKGADDETKAWAMYAIAFTTQEDYGNLRPRNITSLKADLEKAKQIATKAVTQFPETRGAGEARRLLHELTELKVGAPVPEIEGKDAQGKPIKLSDFRGKVVVVDFWQKDCEHCVDMHKIARELLEKFKDKPLAWFGINADDAPSEELRKVLAAEDISWANVLDPSQTVCDAWNVDGYPTVYIVDHEGIIRYREVDREKLRIAVNVLMSRAISAQNKAASKEGAPPTPTGQAGQGTPGESPATPNTPAGDKPKPPPGEKPKP